MFVDDCSKHADGNTDVKQHLKFVLQPCMRGICTCHNGSFLRSSLCYCMLEISFIAYEIGVAPFLIGYVSYDTLVVLAGWSVIFAEISERDPVSQHCTFDAEC